MNHCTYLFISFCSNTDTKAGNSIKIIYFFLIALFLMRKKRINLFTQNTLYAHVRYKYVNIYINSITIIFALCSVSFNKQNLTSFENREDTKFTFFVKAVLRVIRLHCDKLFKLDEYHDCYRHLKGHFVAALSSRTFFIWN